MPRVVSRYRPAVEIVMDCGAIPTRQASRPTMIGFAKHVVDLADSLAGVNHARSVVKVVILTGKNAKVVGKSVGFLNVENKVVGNDIDVFNIVLQVTDFVVILDDLDVVLVDFCGVGSGIDGLASGLLRIEP